MQDDNPEKEEDIDCPWAVLVGMRLGFSPEQILVMRYGTLLDYIVAQDEILKVRTEQKQEEKKQEKRGSLMDL